MPIPPKPSEVLARPDAPSPADWPLGRLLLALFFQPQVLLFLQEARLVRAMRILVVQALLGGLAIAAVEFPKANQRTQDWIRWLGSVTQGISYRDGTLSWNEPSTLPHTTRHEGWKVDFRGETIQDIGEVRTGPERRGVVFTPEQIVAWQEDGETMRVVPLLNDGELMGWLSANAVWPEGLDVGPDAIERLAKDVSGGQFLFLLLKRCLTLLLSAFFYTGLFAAIPLLFRRSLLEESSSGKRIFAFYFYAAIPPLFVAVFYGLLRLPVLHTSEVFVFTMAAYLFLVFRSIRRFLAAR